MSNLAYMVWFVGTALGIIAIVTTGTLAAAGILTKPRRATPTTPPQGQLVSRGRHEALRSGTCRPAAHCSADAPLSRTTISTTGRKSAQAT